MLADVYLPSALNASDARPLQGGVSGAAVWRATVDGQDVVIKRSDRRERQVLMMLGALGEPHIPPVLASGRDEYGTWVMMPFHPGQAAGITGQLPDEIHRCMGRLHAQFSTVRSREGAVLPGVADGFLRSGLQEHAPRSLAAVRSSLGEEYHARARALVDSLATSEAFAAAASQFPVTLIHGDLYGENVLLGSSQGIVVRTQDGGRPPEPIGTWPWVIDWNAAMTGPPMFDVAMTAPFDAAGRRAHGEGWAAAGGFARDEQSLRLEHAWCAALINARYCGVVAERASVEDAIAMIRAGEWHAQEFDRLS